MIIIRLMGGLGNQMQQYALYKKYVSLGKDVRLDLSWFGDDVQGTMKAPRSLELKTFEKVSYLEATPDEVRRLTGGESIIGRMRRKIRNTYVVENRMYDPKLLERDDVYLEGYWAADAYYADVMPVIRGDFTFDEGGAGPAAGEMAARIRESKPSVAVHVRRGDYLDPENEAIFGNIATEEYYSSAISCIREKLPGARFYVFSDDPGYAAQKYGSEPDVTIVDVNRGADSRYDMWLMSLCDAHACANSTFSFWGARLSAGYLQGALRIRPTIQKNTQTFDHELMRELWKGWTFIDPHGKIYDGSSF